MFTHRQMAEIIVAAADKTMDFDSVYQRLRTLHQAKDIIEVDNLGPKAAARFDLETLCAVRIVLTALDMGITGKGTRSLAEKIRSIKSTLSGPQGYDFSLAAVIENLIEAETPAQWLLEFLFHRQTGELVFSARIVKRIVHVNEIKDGTEITYATFQGGSNNEDPFSENIWALESVLYFPLNKLIAPLIAKAKTEIGE